MSDENELPATVHAEIQALCAEGDRLANEGVVEKAVDFYNAAWELVPDPKTRWNASTWILAAIGDACFLGGFWTSAREALEYTMHCPGGVGNPFVHLRLGQALYELDDLDRASDELARAYMGAGPEIYSDQDPKYLDFLQTRMAI